MTLPNNSHLWTTKGASLSDKNASEEYGITREEIIKGIQAGKLQHRVNSAHGNPYLKLLRQEVEALIAETHGPHYLKKRALETKLKKVTTELRSLKRKTNKCAKEKAALEEKLSKLEQ